MAAGARAAPATGAPCRRRRRPSPPSGRNGWWPGQLARSSGPLSLRRRSRCRLRTYQAAAASWSGCAAELALGARIYKEVRASGVRGGWTWRGISGWGGSVWLRLRLRACKWRPSSAPATPAVRDGRAVTWPHPEGSALFACAPYFSVTRTYFSLTTNQFYKSTAAAISSVEQDLRPVHVSRFIFYNKIKSSVRSTPYMNQIRITNLFICIFIIKREKGPGFCFLFYRSDDEQSEE